MVMSVIEYDSMTTRLLTTSNRKDKEINHHDMTASPCHRPQRIIHDIIQYLPWLSNIYSIFTLDSLKLYSWLFWLSQCAPICPDVVNYKQVIWTLALVIVVIRPMIHHSYVND